jgi:hypothetical protein
MWWYRTRCGYGVGRLDVIQKRLINDGKLKGVI